MRLDQPASIADLAIVVFTIALDETIPTNTAALLSTTCVENLWIPSLRRLLILACIFFAWRFLPARWAKVIDQTQRRVYNDEDVQASQKIVSLFEPHTDIIVKGLRDVQFGHKINLSTQQDDFIIYCRIEDGNPADANLYMPVINACQADYDQIPSSAVADGCYASQANVKSAKAMGVKQNVFSKPVGLTLVDMGVKKKTFDILRNFRAGVEGNIS